MRTLLFVYGTLKTGCSAHVRLAGQEFVGEAETVSQYRLLDGGSFPCLVHDLPRGYAVRGEVWRVDEDALRRLDQYEEVPIVFARAPVAVTGFSVPVVAYFYRGDISAARDLGCAWSAPG